MERQDYLSGEDSLPGDYSRYLSGKKVSVPDADQGIKYRLARLYKVDDFNRLASSISNTPKSESFQRFLDLQSNPDSLVRSSMKLPNTPFGPMGSYA